MYCPLRNVNDPFLNNRWRGVVVVHDLDYAMASLAPDQTKCLNYLKECAVSPTNLDSLLSEFTQHQRILRLMPCACCYLCSFTVTKSIMQRRQRKCPVCVCVLAFRVWFPELALHVLVSWFNICHCRHSSLQRCVDCGQIVKPNERWWWKANKASTPWTVKRAKTRVIFVLWSWLGETNASLTLFPHSQRRQCLRWVRHNDARHCLTHSWFLHSNSPVYLRFFAGCLGVSLNPKYFIRMTDEGRHVWCCWMLQNKWSSLQRYASDYHTCTPINLRLWDWVCLAFGCLDLVCGFAWIETSCGLLFGPCTALFCCFVAINLCLARDWEVILPWLQDRGAFDWFGKMIYFGRCQEVICLTFE